MFGLGALISIAAKGMTSGQARAAGGLGLAAILVPVGLLFWGFAHGAGQYDKGAQSKAEQISKLTAGNSLLTKDLAAANSDLSLCRANNETVSKYNRRLSGEIAANKTAHIQALEAQRSSAAAAQEASKVAVNALAAARNNNASAFQDLKNQLEGLSYGTDEDGNQCVVRGGARVLRNARAGAVE